MHYGKAKSLVQEWEEPSTGDMGLLCYFNGAAGGISTECIVLHTDTMQLSVVPT